jgi:cytochrome c
MTMNWFSSRNHPFSVGAALALLLCLGTAGAATAADADQGANIFKRCTPCHTIEPGGPNRVGPNLHGIFGRKAGSLEGYVYSKAMAASDVVWTPETLDRYLADPKALVPGTKMTFVGVKKDDERGNLIAYLEQAAK